MAFDVQGARNAGYSEEEIAQYLETKSDKSIPKFDIPAGKFDVQGALNAGYTEREIADYAVSKGWGVDEPKVSPKPSPLSAVKEGAIGAGETLLSTVSGLAAMPVAGIAGLATSLGGLYPERGAETVEKVSNALTYKPQTEAGKFSSEVVNKPFEWMDTGAGYVGEKVSGLTGSPELGAATKAGIMLIAPGIIGKGIKVARRIGTKGEVSVTPKEVVPTEVAKDGGIPVEEMTAKKPMSVMEGFEQEAPPSRVVKSPEMATETVLDKQNPLKSSETASLDVLDSDATNRPSAIEKTSQEASQRVGLEGGETGITELAKQTEKLALEKELTDDGFGQLTEYSKMKMSEQSDMAVSLMDTDWEKAKRVAFGQDPLPDGMQPATIFKAVKNRAFELGDVDTLRTLATESPLARTVSEHAQALKAADAFKNPMDPVVAMQEVAKAREETATRTGRKPVDVGKLETVVEEKKTAYEQYLDKRIAKESKGKVEYGSQNTVITNESYLAAKAELKSKMGSLSAGVDPTAMAPLAKIGMYHLEAGAKTFKAWSKAMIQDLGAWVKPHLNDLWNESKKALKEEKAPEVAQQRYKTRMANETSKLTEKTLDLDFTEKEKRVTKLDKEGQRIKDEYERAKKAHKAGVEASGKVTQEEATKIVELSKAVSDARNAMDADRNIHTKLQHAAAQVVFEKYIDHLKGGDASLTKQLKNRMGQFGKEAKDNVAYATLNLGKDAAKTMMDNSIAIVASMDNSFFGRQGAPVLMTHPTVWGRNFFKSFDDIIKTLGGREVADAVKVDRYSRENHLNGGYDDAKLFTTHEEPHPTSAPGRIPLVGRLYKASEMAYRLGAERMRMDLYDLLEKKARDAGVDTTSKVWREEVGSMIGSLTGRARVGKIMGSEATRVILWAPRLLKANWDVMTAHTGGAGLHNKWVRNEAYKNTAKILVETVAICKIAQALGAKVEWDPRSSDFLAIRINNTRYKFAGAAQLATLISRGGSGILEWAGLPITGGTKNTQTGKITPYSGKPGKRAYFDTVIDFFANKTTPMLGAAISFTRQKDFEGKKPTLGSAIYKTHTPITVQQIIQTLQKPLPESIAGIALDWVGISSNTYEPKKRR